jgi:peptidoglycan/xylan/chitin deacetylase (PgdA/CDA1 family)
VAAEVVTRAEVGDRRLAALTFDDGPAGATEAVLDLLAAHGARATFFVLGRQVAGREGTLRRALAEGHELGNHGWSHLRATEAGAAEVREELERTAAAIEAATGVRPRLARPPYGDGAEAFAAAAAAAGLAPTVLWSVDPEDWRPGEGAAIAARVLERVHPGAIVDLHDGWGRTPASREPTVAALAVLLPALAGAGWASLTVSELLEAQGASRSTTQPAPSRR